MSRREEALRLISLDSTTGLEIGPLFSPLVAKAEADVFYIDHMSTEDLQTKYENHPINTGSKRLEKIVPVDYVLQNNSLQTTLKGKKFDYVIASHVIEHVPNMIGWLKDIESILKPGGILSLVIPDRRYTFDIMRRESRPADIIGAYLDKQNKINSTAMFDYMVNFKHKIVAAEVWQHPEEDYSLKPGIPLNRVYEVCLDNIKPGNYVDAHCFVFTPYSFFDIIRTLINLDLFDYEVAYFKDTPENELEFYVTLRKVEHQTRQSKIRSLPKLRKPVEPSELYTKINDLKRKIDEYETSRSWQVTKPIRSLSSWVKRLK